MKKALLFLSLIWACLSTINAYAITFYIHEIDRTYNIDTYNTFIQNIRGFFQTQFFQEIHITICADNGESTLLTVNLTDVYITQINNTTLTNRELHYDSTFPRINRSTVNDAITNLADFPTNRGDAARPYLKILACIVSEAVRFINVSTLVANALQQNSGFQWSIIEAEIKAWAKICLNMTRLNYPYRNPAGFYVGIPDTQARRAQFVLQEFSFNNGQ